MSNILPPRAARWAVPCWLLCLLLKVPLPTTAQTAPPAQTLLGAAAEYGLLSGGSIQANCVAQAQGKAGAAQSIAATIYATDTTLAQGGGNVSQALTDLQAARAYYSGLASQPLSGVLGGQLGSGVYSVAGNATLATGSILTISGDSSTQVVIRVSGSLTFAANSAVVLNGVRPEHVIWSVGQQLSIQEYTATSGVMLVGGAATIQGWQSGRRTVHAQGTVSLSNLGGIGSHNTFFRPGPHPNPGPIINPPSCNYTPQACNLVQDGSFECLLGCPGITVAGDLIANLSAYWRGGGGTPDVFHTCNTIDGDFGVPFNASNSLFPGHNPPRIWPPNPVSPQGTPAMAQHSTALTGNGYAGIYTLSGREYIKQQLASSLAPNTRYYAEFYQHIAPNAGYSAEKLGLALASANVSAPLPSIPLSLTPVVEGVAAANLGWQRIGGVFTAPSTANSHIVVGDFSPVPTSAVLAAHHNGPSASLTLASGANHADASYYYIDNVLLSPLTEAGPAYTFCAYAPLVQLGTCPLPAQTSPSYHWQVVAGTDPTLTAANENLPNPWVQPDATTEYELTVTVNGQSYTSRTTITITPPTLPATARFINCGQSVSLSVCASAVAGAAYSWSASHPGFTGQGPSISDTPGATTQYFLTVSMPGRTRVYTSQQTVYVVPQAGPSQNVACGTPATLPTCGDVNSLPGASYFWTAGSVSVAASLNPTLTPSSPSTTYTLVIFFQNQLFPGGQTTVTVNNGQPCPAPCARTYRNNGTYVNPLPGGAPEELGNANRSAPVTQISAGGRTMTFDGSYHVVGPVELVDGEFYLEPGTVFYVEGGNDNWPVIQQGQQCYSDVLGSDHYIQLFVGKGATLHLNGATLTAACDRMWGGVELVDDGRIVTERDSRLKLRSRISEARVGLLLGSPCRSREASYSLFGTDFYNNTYGVVALGNDKPMNPDECRIENCRFFSDHTNRLEPDEGNGRGDGDYTRTGLVLRGDFHSDIPYRGNSFYELNAGAEVAGQGVALEENAFERCYQVAVRVGDPGVRLFSGSISVLGNKINVPANPQPGGQVPPASNVSVAGIELLEMGMNGLFSSVLHIERNTICSEVPPSQQKHRIGLDGYLSFNNTRIEHSNFFQSLDIGVRLMDASGLQGTGPVVADNQFETCTKAVSLHGQRSAVFTPTIACNDMAADYGIVIEQGADVGDQGNQGEPCGNRFSLFQATIVNDGLNAINYYYDFDRNEAFLPLSAVSTIGRGVQMAPGCNVRSFTTFGLQRPVGSNASLQTQAKQWQQLIFNQQGSPKELHEFEQLLLDYFAQCQQWADLEAFITTLPLRNDTSFERLSLHLLETYRRLGQPADAQRVQADLWRWRSSSPDVQQRLGYLDVSERLRRLGAGQLPSAADSTMLADIAASKASCAPVACTTLRYYYPRLACDTKNGKKEMSQSSSSSQLPMHSRLGNALPSGRVMQLFANPNPATETVSIQITGLIPQGECRLELIEIATGQLMHTLNSPISTERIEMDVRRLPLGVYALRLQQGGLLLGTCKLVVLH